VSDATRQFSLRVQAGDLRGLVDDKALTKCVGLPQEILKALLSLPSDENGVPENSTGSGRRFQKRDFKP